jgi:hypothetical protein
MANEKGVYVTCSSCESRNKLCDERFESEKEVIRGIREWMLEMEKRSEETARELRNSLSKLFYGVFTIVGMLAINLASKFMTGGLK